MPRPVCANCHLPQATCLCGWIRPTDNQLQVLVLQHPLESAQAKGSLRLLALSLARCTCLVGETFDDAALSTWLGPPGHSLLLYPGPDALPHEGSAPCPDPPEPEGQPRQLVLLDGTWRQAGRLLRTHPLLQALPRWSLPAPPPSRYRIRSAPRPGRQRSTLEAACLALGALERRPHHYASLLAAFGGWVDTVAARAPGRNADGSARHPAETGHVPPTSTRPVTTGH